MRDCLKSVNKESVHSAEEPSRPALCNYIRKPLVRSVVDIDCKRLVEQFLELSPVLRGDVNRFSKRNKGGGPSSPGQIDRPRKAFTRTLSGCGLEKTRTIVPRRSVPQWTMDRMDSRS